MARAQENKERARKYAQEKTDRRNGGAYYLARRDARGGAGLKTTARARGRAPRQCQAQEGGDRARGWTRGHLV